ncbi:MAG TPA: response regulator [Actinomycetota bacterium]|nr:response regulator [Actinomycetota bacterium]
MSELGPQEARILSAPILIVDDEALNVELLEAILEEAGFTAVTSTTDPQIGLDLCATVRPDLLLLDVMMPVIDGFGVLDGLREDPDAPEVIVLTADVTAETKRRALSCGAADFLTKPLDTVEVVLRTRNLVVRRLLEHDLAESVAHLEDRVRSRTEELERAYEHQRSDAIRLRHLDAMKDAFLVSVSHELRTPLTVVGGIASLLHGRLERLPRTQVVSLLGSLRDNAERLERLLLTVLDIDKLRRGTFEANRQPTDLAALVDRVVADLAAQLGDRPVEVSLGVIQAEIDGGYLERILDALLVNVIRHTPASEPVNISTEATAEGLRLIIDDRGPGVPDERKVSVFERFDWGPKQNEVTPGLGSGLCLVAGFADLHGGSAWVEDRPGGGASFRVVLAPERPEAAGAAASP